MIKITSKGNFEKTDAFFKRISKKELYNDLHNYAQQGVEALAAATPKDSGKTAASWNYEIVNDKQGISIIWTNSNINNGVPIAIILQYGHGTGTGGFVQGIDYINPSIKPIFDEIAESIWKEVTD